MRMKAAFFLLLTVLIGLPLAAQSTAQACEDVAGASDHPSVPRYAGSCLIGYSADAYNEARMAASAARHENRTFVADDVVELEGALTRLLYIAPHGRSALEVFRNYQNALEERGYSIVFTCAGDACGNNRAMRGFVYGGRPLTNSGQISEMAFMGRPFEGERYLLARTDDGASHVAVYLAHTNLPRLPRGMPSDESRRVVVHVEILEREAMQERMVDAAEMARSLTESGRVELENIYFDTNAASLTPQSDPALQEAARLLADNPRLALYVVGHTDATGGYEANLQLSQRRAESVVEALVSQHGVQRDRVVPAGVGPLAPVANNGTEAGRAKNRRVELVQR